uniref:4-(cytidine 5'-diphospho)-2-C-methyl-D-erythritol kinase n=1 Tax=Paulinella longichromatophora TaxID=1708747 RepID=A0A2H4ZNI3_9EUKA|nr:putative 4-diphosphocytidyl -2C-methyl-D- erythritol kinase (CMK) [Paulinella longichromatophora]
MDSASGQTPLIVSAPAKINLHLEILGIRSDSFHELAMIMQSVDVADTLFFENNSNGTILLKCNTSQLITDENNLIIQAADLLKFESGLCNLGAVIHLEKRIPIGAGLAGGSSNGAAALMGLNKLWNLGYTSTQLLNFAAKLGSDVPFTMKGGAQFCFGRGEILEPIKCIHSDEANLAILLIKSPKTSISTPWAFQQYKKIWESQYLKEEIDFSIRRQILRENNLIASISRNDSLPSIKNDLQKVVEEREESVRKGLYLLRSRGENLGIAMSGSGPSLFALFRTLDLAQVAQFKLAEILKGQDYESWCSSLLPYLTHLDEYSHNE